MLAVFDLDYTVWQPEMYQLHSKPRFIPAPPGLSPKVLQEVKTVKEGMILADKRGSPIRVFHGAAVALADIHQLQQQAEGVDIRAAVASRTDEPDWAHYCMKHLVINDDGITLEQCFGPLVEISFQNKIHHLQRLHKKTGIPYEQMVFFDNEYGNIRSVSSLGVKCIYTPNGMQEEHWKEAKRYFKL